MSDIVTGSTAMALELTALRAEVERFKASLSDAVRQTQEQADDITALRAENERLKIENIQMQAALGYGILADDERHILPSNPFKCGTCDASKHLRAENERLRAVLEGIADLPPGYADMRQDDLVVILANKARAVLEGKL